MLAIYHADGTPMRSVKLVDVPPAEWVERMAIDGTDEIYVRSGPDDTWKEWGVNQWLDDLSDEKTEGKPDLFAQWKLAVEERSEYFRSWMDAAKRIKKQQPLFTDEIKHPTLLSEKLAQAGDWQLMDLLRSYRAADDIVKKIEKQIKDQPKIL